MEYFFPDQYGPLLYFLAVGIVAGIMYDIILIKRETLKTSKIGMFVGDIMFCVAFCALLTVCVLKVNYGMIRWYEVLLPFLTFIMYRCSISVITVKIGAVVLSITIKALRFILLITIIAPTGRMLRFAASFRQKMLDKLRNVKQKRRSNRIRRDWLCRAERGFDMDRK